MELRGRLNPPLVVADASPEATRPAHQVHVARSRSGRSTGGRTPTGECPLPVGAVVVGIGPLIPSACTGGDASAVHRRVPTHSPTPGYGVWKMNQRGKRTVGHGPHEPQLVTRAEGPYRRKR